MVTEVTDVHDLRTSNSIQIFYPVLKSRLITRLHLRQLTTHIDDTRVRCILILKMWTVLQYCCVYLFAKIRSNGRALPGIRSGRLLLLSLPSSPFSNFLANYWRTKTLRCTCDIFATEYGTFIRCFIRSISQRYSPKRDRSLHRAIINSRQLP